MEICSYGDRQSISLGIYNHLCVWDCRALYPATNSRDINLSTAFSPPRQHPATEGPRTRKYVFTLMSEIRQIIHILIIFEDRRT